MLSWPPLGLLSNGRRLPFPQQVDANVSVLVEIVEQGRDITDKSWSLSSSVSSGFRRHNTALPERHLLPSFSQSVGLSPTLVCSPFPASMVRNSTTRKYFNVPCPTPWTQMRLPCVAVLLWGGVGSLM